MIIGHGQYGKVYLADHQPTGLNAARESLSVSKVHLPVFAHARARGGGVLVARHGPDTLAPALTL
jgi:serine/threonine protein kinase